MRKKLGLLFVLLLPFLFVQLQSNEVHAKTIIKHGVVEKVEGEVTFQKGASFNRIPVAVSQKWQQGDVIRTKKGASVDIKMPETGDSFYIGENSEVYFTHENENVFVHVLKGSIYVAANKRDSEKEALFIISGKESFKVLGTHFFIGVDPHTGETLISVFSGIVQSRADRGEQANDTDERYHIYPSQESYFFNDDTDSDTPPPIVQMDLDQFIERHSADFIYKLLDLGDNIDNENREMSDLIREGLRNQGYLMDDQYDGHSGFSEEDLERLRSNLDYLVSNIINTALAKNRVDSEEIERLVDELNRRNPNRRIDLDNVPPYERLGLTDHQREQQERQEQMRQQREEQLARERQRQEEQRNRNQEILDRLAQQRDNQAQRQETERQRLEEERRQQLEEERRPAPAPRPAPPRLTPINFNIASDDSYVSLLGDDFSNYSDIEIWINGEQLDSSVVSDENVYKLEIVLFTKPENEIEIFGYEDGKKTAYGMKVFEPNPFTPAGLELSNITSNEIYISWKTLEQFIFSWDSFSLEVYEVESNELVRTITTQGLDGMGVTIENLKPNTDYIIHEKLHGIVISKTPFKTNN